MGRVERPAKRSDKRHVVRDRLGQQGVHRHVASYAQTLGKLSLDQRPGRYPPQLDGSAIDEASLLHLGTYTDGGLPLQFPGGITNIAETVTYLQQWNPSAAPGA